MNSDMKIKPTKGILYDENGVPILYFDKIKYISVSVERRDEYSIGEVNFNIDINCGESKVIFPQLNGKSKFIDIVNPVEIGVPTSAKDEDSKVMKSIFDDDNDGGF